MWTPKEGWRTWARARSTGRPSRPFRGGGLPPLLRRARQPHRTHGLGSRQPPLTVPRHAVNPTDARRRSSAIRPDRRFTACRPRGFCWRRRWRRAPGYCGCGGLDRLGVGRRHRVRRRRVLPVADDAGVRLGARAPQRCLGPWARGEDLRSALAALTGVLASVDESGFLPPVETANALRTVISSGSTSPAVNRADALLVG